MMKNCSLCLEKINKTEMLDVNSTLLLANNVKELIGKHLWPMVIQRIEAFPGDRCYPVE